MENTQNAEPKERKLLVVLERASLSLYRAFSWDKPALLNSDDHQSVLRRQGRDVSEARPDIVHQCVLTLMDSPLNKAGHLQIFIRTAEGDVIKINPECRIPRTYKRFSGLIVKLLRERQTSGSLLEVMDSPLPDLLPKDARKIALSWNATKYKAYDYFKTNDDGRPIVVSVGTMASGLDNFADDYAEEKISISDYSLSASAVCAKITNVFEDLWQVD